MLLIQPIVDCLISNATLSLSSISDKPIYLDQFYIYFDLSSIKSIDWIQKEDLIRNYKRKIDFANLNLKRRFSVDNLSLVVQSEENINKPVVLNSVKTELKPKRLMTTQVVLQKERNENLKQMDSNFEKFLSVLNKEKENNFKFENRLRSLASNDGNNDLESSGSAKACDLGKTDLTTGLSKLDGFLNKLDEEKAKNQQFNDKLNKMLWK